MGFFSTSNKGLMGSVGISRGVLQDCMKRLNNTYEESGGDPSAIGKDDITLPSGETLTLFEAKAYFLIKKIELTKSKIQRRDEVLNDPKHNIAAGIRLKNEVNKMLGHLRFERKELIKIAKKNSKRSKSFWYRNNKEYAPENIDKQFESIAHITKHIVTLDELNKARLRKMGVNKQELAFRAEQDPDDLQEQDIREHLNQLGVTFESDPDTVMDQLQLPQLDISESLDKIQRNEDQYEKYLDQINSTLDVLTQQTTDIQDGVKETSHLLKHMERKATKHNASLTRLNKRMDRALNQARSTNRMILCTCMLCIVVFLLVITLGILAAYSSYLPDVSDVI
mmetsp:Transcript_4038/g.5960  ORF Transcript_4038/g.5960 Transcript_4038/m.5960 type:complete len:338 (+) Transcript_4038:32-1045(+)